jgi:hypothetical protein
MLRFMKPRKKMTRLLVIAALLSIPASAVAQVTTDEGTQLEQRYKGMPLRVRDLLSDSKIRYDANGKLLGKWHPGQWTWHSNVEVTGVEAKATVLRIKANRLLLNYNRSSNKFDLLRTKQTVEIEIQTSPSVDGKVDLDKEWNKAFLTETEKYPLDMQPYWEPFIACLVNPKTEECEYYERKARDVNVYNVNPSSTWKPAYPGVYAVGGDVLPPKVKSIVKAQAETRENLGGDKVAMSSGRHAARHLQHHGGSPAMS